MGNGIIIFMFICVFYFIYFKKRGILGFNNVSVLLQDGKHGKAWGIVHKDG